ncbi:S9 family peptidase [Apibacter adventoris]|uniref:S9 family peptidase n=1 Tax=Apibacter adventoris TaxID=1679466 RepID=UPI000CF64725|nr:S9 family peptidase [Apibacter adventoris]PQL93325.1 S9 family peptidase [Apibacter adventoris]
MKKLIICIAMATTVGYNSQEIKELPGDISLPSSKDELQKIASYDKSNYKYSVEDYWSKPKQSGFKFSPDGKYFSYREKDEKGKNHLYVKNTSNNEVKRILEEKEELIRGYAWVNNKRLIYIQDQGGNENYQLFAIDLTGENNKALTPFDNVRVEILRVLKEQPDYVIIMMNKDNPQIFEPYKLNIKTGELVKLFENKDISAPIMGYEFDKDGNLRAYTQQQNGTEYSLYYRTNDKSPFNKVVTTTWKDSFSILEFDYQSSNPDYAYVASNLNSDKSEIILFDLKNNKEIKKIYNDPTYDVSDASFSRKRNYELDYISFTGEKPEIIAVSPEFKKIYSKLEKQFNGYFFTPVNKTDKEDKYLIYVGSDKLYGKYYLYDITADKVSLLMDLMPNLKEQDMAEMRPVTFKSRDGLTLHGYITIPKEISKNNKVPLIVNPHGGPYGPRDKWHFNPETQLFASRGYATLQINYRGSGGYGKDFLLAGSKQIGRNMLNDLEDGVAYAKSLDFIDENKIAIYGGSYGGLATLGSLVKTPDLYTCGVDYVGVSNLFTFFNSFPPYWKPYMGQFKEQWYDFDSEEDQKIMKKVSPALNIDKIKKPLFVIQGANDPRVNINESDQIVKNLRNKGYEVPYMVKYNEGHGFGHEDNRIELYKTMMGFFAKYLK